MDGKERLEFFRPGNGFPAVSVTGGRCELMCDHCRGEHLRRMFPAVSGEDLAAKARDIVGSGGCGMLLSGGCDMRGKVPLAGFAAAIGETVGMGLEVNVHPGFLDREEAQALADAGVGAFSLDLHQDPRVIRDVLHLDVGPEEYSRTLDNILSVRGRAVPHITAGFGTDDLVLSAELARSKGLREIILLGLVKTRNAAVENITDEGMISAVRILRDMGMDVILGCMRPRSHRLEVGCIGEGVRKIANPSPRTVSWAEENDMDHTEHGKCCAMLI